MFGSLPFLALEDAVRRHGPTRVNDAITDAEVQRALARVTGGPDHRENYKLLCMERWFSLVYVAHGRHDYEVSPGLAQRLRHTELRGLSCDDLHLPHPCIQLRVPIEAGITLPDTAGPDLPVTGLLLAEEPEPGRCWRLCVEASRHDGQRTLNLISVSLPAGQDLDTALDSHESKAQHAGEHWRAIWAWAMNVVLYATSGGVREEVWRNREARQLRDRLEKLPKGPKRDKLREQLKAMDVQRRVVLGPGAVPLEAPPQGTTGRPLVVRTRVSGHWKRQPHGQALAERKLIWVQPYWRGPEDATAPSGTIHGLV
ncbi:hypothetical protein QEG98_28120 [Myxococcus sp. MxC21-1]|uniref:hypothetical protein n=1 Tax=Myxococcus sp. MxC21-1 TaxID=3041439 RepID=UPI00292D0652|nr:hypothetical protein [Myxococcus sp. MxC21-1]WNZ59872.1 hypothetical protein QEG98_28120 [Myxococcus sp. MxC21-1]